MSSRSGTTKSVIWERVSYLVEINSCVLIGIHFADEHVGFFLAHVKAARLDQSFHFNTAELALPLPVETLESFKKIEGWVAGKPLAYLLALSLNLEVGAPR